MPRRRINNTKRPSKRFKELRKMVVSTQTYPLADAIALAKKTSLVKFDASVEVHVRLGIDPRKGDQAIRATVALPHGNGKKIRIAAIVPDALQKEVTAAGAVLVGGMDLINQIADTKKIDFDILVTTPDMMKDMAKVAKILGPKGMMPNPKTETVTPNAAKAVAELLKGKVSYKNDDTANVHVAIGKVSFTEKQLEENVRTFIEAINKIKPSSSKGVYIRSMHLTTSMGPSIKFSV